MYVANPGMNAGGTFLEPVMAYRPMGEPLGVCQLADGHVCWTESVLVPELSDWPVPIDPPVVPEPAVWMLLIAGFAMVGFAARKKRLTIAN